MDECDQAATGADARILIYQTHSSRSESLHLRVQILHLETNVMEPFSPPGDEPGDGRILRSGLEQLDAAFTYWNHRNPSPLLRNLFDLPGPESQCLRIDLQRLFQRAHRDCDMINFMMQAAPGQSWNHVSCQSPAGPPADGKDP